MLAFRPARDEDLDVLTDIHLQAFPDDRGVVERHQNFRSNPWGPLADLHVATDGGVPVAHAFLFGMKAWFGGALVPVGGIASVAVAPEARGRGIARSLLQHLHGLASQRGDAVTVLYPFRQGFYAQLGYRPVTPYRRLTLTPSAIPREWSREAAAAGLRVGPATGANRGALRGIYERVASRQTGALLRPEALWERRLQDERRLWFVAEREGSVVGYLAWSVHQREAHAVTRIAVHEVVAEDHEARRALLGLVGAQRDQVAEVELSLAEGDPLDRALVDADGGRFGDAVVEHNLGIVAGGPMVRFVELHRAVAARGYARDGALDVRTRRGGAAFRLVVKGGKGHLEPPTGAGPVLVVDVDALPAIFYGGLLPSDAARLGWVDAPVEGSEAIGQADQLLTLPPYFSVDAF